MSCTQSADPIQEPIGSAMRRSRIHQLHHPQKMDPQRIIRLQKLYQNSNQKLWYTGARSRALVYPYYALFTASTAYTLYYFGRAVCGLKAED